MTINDDILLDEEDELEEGINLSYITWKETLEELEKEEEEKFSGHKLDTFSQAIDHDWIYLEDERYFES
ncbi:MAG: hypothetical protein ACD_49C00059G0010 [uncultured bacterium (gcode 4)]|uniref:Uncharacterized protein n=1 Tax=uncultured bacterium (gcode 4) TaxID=1234023 RepID=K2AWS9_9BACT|nr:MAG: hypothetical protein ACD_49C00059G0010 [uncultured bacterium (gcode 4)]